MSRRGYYLGGHTVVSPYSSWFKNPLRKKKPRKNPRVKLKKKPRAPRKSPPPPEIYTGNVASPVDQRDWDNACRWARMVAPAAIARILKREDLTFLQHEALKQRLVQVKAKDALAEARRWAATVDNIPKMLLRTTLTMAQREALIDLAVERKNAAGHAAARKKAGVR